MTATTYSDWAEILDRFEKEDDTVFEDMNAGSFVLCAGTAQRFCSRAEEVYKKRKKSWLDKFQRSCQMQNVKTEDDFGIILRNGKQNLLPLSKFVTSKGLPDELKKTLHKDLEDFVAEIRKSLKDNISKINKDSENILLMLNTFTMIENPQEASFPKKKKNQNDNNLIPPTGRKIIL